MKKLGIALLVLLSFAVLAAQDKQQKGSDWESIPMDEWKESHVNYILERSAWAKVIRGDLRNAILSSTPDLSIQVASVGAPNDTFVLLRSSLLIRYALLRQRQLMEKYDVMNSEARKAFDLKNKSLLECPACEKYYVVSIRGRHWSLRNKPLIMGNSALVYLSDEKGEKRTLANFVPEPEDGGEAIFYFPRNDASGKPLLGADSDKLIFNFTIRFNRDEDGYIAPGAHVSMFDGMEFKARDLVRNGKVIF